MGEPSVFRVTEYLPMKYHIYLLIDSSGNGYIFSLNKEPEHVCPCCMLPEHRWDIASVIRGLRSRIKIIHWLSPYRREDGKGYGDDANLYDELASCGVNFVTILVNEFPLEVNDLIAGMR